MKHEMATLVCQARQKYDFIIGSDAPEKARETVVATGLTHEGRQLVLLVWLVVMVLVVVVAVRRRRRDSGRQSRA